MLIAQTLIVLGLFRRLLSASEPLAIRLLNTCSKRLAPKAGDLWGWVVIEVLGLFEASGSRQSSA